MAMDDQSGVGASQVGVGSAKVTPLTLESVVTLARPPCTTIVPSRTPAAGETSVRGAPW
jgi:hypothetical protein